MIQSVLIKKDLGSCCLLVVEDWNWNSPRPLTRDAPVSTRDDEGIDAIFTNIRDPLNLTRSRYIDINDVDVLQMVQVK